MIECKCDHGENKIIVKGSFVDIFCDLSHLLISLYKAVKTIDDNYGDLFLHALHGFRNMIRFWSLRSCIQPNPMK